MFARIVREKLREGKKWREIALPPQFWQAAWMMRSEILGREPTLAAWPGRVTTSAAISEVQAVKGVVGVYVIDPVPLGWYQT